MLALVVSQLHHRALLLFISAFINQSRQSGAVDLRGLAFCLVLGTRSVRKVLSILESLQVRLNRGHLSLLCPSLGCCFEPFVSTCTRQTIGAFLCIKGNNRVNVQHRDRRLSGEAGQVTLHRNHRSGVIIESLEFIQSIASELHTLLAA